MSRTFRALAPLLVSVGALVTLGPSLSGCSSAEPGITVLGLTNSTKTCIYTASDATSIRYQGAFDIKYAPSYTTPVSVRSRLASRADKNAGRLEANAVTLTDVEVTIYDGDNAIVGPYLTSMSGITIEPGADGVVLANLIPGEVIPQLRGLKVGPGGRDFRVLATFRGKTSGQTAIETEEAQFLVNINEGGLVIGDPTSTTTCPAPSPADLQSLKNVCNPGINDVVTCQCLLYTCGG